MDKSDNAEVCRERVETQIRFVDGSGVVVSGDVTKEFPRMSGNVGFLQLYGNDGIRIVVNLDNVTYMRVFGDEVVDDGEDQ